ncbi:hypothetical protein BITS_1526 [Bifidobacterium tsurumiense]|uniref:Uncharacterized protein n=1 Tax=Bifidobacterium tsurumiense TaxID=356829 RepID=A0A087EH49_9BIFI|nr:hypothetical protein BITS_1526 [Bifidobacterium tsurumiense]
MFRLRIGWIDGFAVANHRQRQHAVILLQLLTQCVDANPDAVGIEVWMTRDALRGRLVIGMHLAHLAQHQPSGSRVTNDMAAFAIRIGSCGDFCHEGCTGIFKMLCQGSGRAGTKIIRIRYEQVFKAAFAQLVQQTRFPDRREQIAMPWWTPFQCSIFRIRDWLACGLNDLRLLVLDYLGRNLFLLEMTVLMQHAHRIVSSAEGIHEGQRQRNAKTGSSGEHLPDDDVQKAHFPRLMATNHEQRFGLFQSHRRAQSAIELQERGFGECADCLIMIDRFIHFMEAWNISDRFYGILTNPATRLFVAPHIIQSAELRYCHFTQTVLAHLVCRMFEHILSAVHLRQCPKPF